MREIGGYIQLDVHRGSDYHEGALALNCGRAAIEYLIEARGIKKLLVPSFCCDSVSQPCRKKGIPVEYYRIDRLLRPMLDDAPGEGEWLLLVNFYGQLSNGELAEYKRKYTRVIADNTQAYFQKPVPGMDTLYSCRKFFGVADGAFLYTDSALSAQLPRDESFDRMRHVLGRFERPASEFYALAAANNELFESEPIKLMSRLTHDLLRAVDYSEAQRRRTENFAYLHSRLGGGDPLKLAVPTGAFMYPLYRPDGERLRKRLQAEKIYVPTLWPDVLRRCPAGSLEYDLALNILPLPVDQRYDTGDMKYICEVIENV